jgi:hypothetical protein
MNNEEENNKYEYFISVIISLNPLKIGNHIYARKKPLNSYGDVEKVLEELREFYDSKEVKIISIQRLPI